MDDTTQHTTQRTTQQFDDYFHNLVGMDMQTLLAPIHGDVAVGDPASHDESYRRIRHEREEEDASLPLGAWERELKRADWNAASHLAAKALAKRSKDLQLAAWLFEALIARSGFQALAPCVTLIDRLLQQYGAQLHPQDTEHRINLLTWINQKLLLPLRKVQITATGGDHDYAWNDWEHARRNEQLRSSLGKQADIEGPTLSDVNAALACTPYERIAFVQRCLADGLVALTALKHTVDATVAGDAPGFGAMRGMLERVEVVLSAEARRRGVSEAPPVHDAVIQAPEQGESTTRDMPDAMPGLADRHEAYAALASIAHVLEHIEPHSPVPYLIRRAVAWGSLNTAQLYNEVFVRCGGHINIFELLGLEDQTAHAEQAT